MGKPTTLTNATDRIRSGAILTAARARELDRTPSSQVYPTTPRSESSFRSASERPIGRPGSRRVPSTALHLQQIVTAQEAANVDVEKGLATEGIANKDGDSTTQDSRSPGEKSTAVNDDKKTKQPKLPIKQRSKRGIVRFWMHTKHALTHSWMNVLLVFVPIGIAAEVAHLNPAIIFAMNSVAIIPLAGMLTLATESVASRLGDTWGALLNVSFGNAVELIIFIIGLVKNEVRVVQAALLGSILANLLLILGMAFLVGGLRYREQIYNSTVTQLSACLLSLSVMSLLLPTAFHASFEDNRLADDVTLKVSRGTSVILLLVYGLYLLFQLKSHSYLYQGMPQEQIDEETEPAFLHEMFETSSSSSSSSSSGSSSDSDTASHSAKHRIRRAFQKRRKSSSHSSRKNGTDKDSMIEDSAPNALAINEPATNESVAKKATNSPLDDVVSGDEGDVEVAATSRADGRPQVRDFQHSAASLSNVDANQVETEGYEHSRPRMSSKQRRKSKRDERSEKRRAKRDKKRFNGGGVVSEEEGPTGHHVVFAGQPSGSGHEVPELATTRPAAKSRASFMRPALPKLFSENVFVQAARPAELQRFPSQVQKSRGQPATIPSFNRLQPIQPNFQTIARPGDSVQRSKSSPNLKSAASQQSVHTPTIPGRGFQPSVLPPALPKRRPTEDQDGNNTDENDDDWHDPEMSRVAAVILLLASTGLVAICAEFLVDAIPAMTEKSAVSQAFIGLIILPIVGNAAEHATAVTVAAKNKMDLAIGVALGSSIQISLFITPLVVIIGWAMNREMSLYFTLFETVSLFVTAFVVNFLVLDGRSNYLEGTLLMAAYVIIAIAAFFYPDTTDASELGGTARNNTAQAIAQPLVEAAAHFLVR